MCGRFTQLYKWEDLIAAYRVLEPAPSNLEPRYNIAPTQAIDIVRADGDRHTAARARWGLVPIWWKKDKLPPSTFNARGETAAEKPMFRSAFKARRCIVPASGFYEWTGPKTDRQPWYISAADGGLLDFAGLYETYRDPESGEDRLSATIVTCDANDFMGRLHSRMPVILDARDIDAWLEAPRTDLLRPAAEDRLQAWRVSTGVNSNRYHEPDAIAPVAG